MKTLATCTVALLLGVFAAPGAVDAETVFADGFEEICPIYYADADGDGFGDPQSFTQTCGDPPAGSALNSGDCNDGDDSINPGVAEPTPDDLYVDENCDGVDGNVNLAVFVSQLEGADSPLCGSIHEPCLTMTKGLQRAKEMPVQQVYIQEANYFETLNVGQSIALYGGYAPGDWIRAFRTVQQSRLVGQFNDVRNYTVRVMGVTAEFNNLWLVGPGTPQTANDLNSYTIIGDTGSTILINDSQLEQGAGANGAQGDPGTSASQVAADSGGIGSTGAELAINCDLVTPSGGSQGMNPSAASADGGAGGHGGSMDTSCFLGLCDNCTATSGENGHSAEKISGFFGTGGPGGAGSATCGQGQEGWPGVAAVDGSGGGGGSGGSFVGAFWVSTPGQGGQQGTDGGGGGGGGGAGGCDLGTDSRGSGGGGGGAGGAKAISVGQGGEGGGGSFGVYLTNATLTAIDSFIVRGNGGTGGIGGASGLGQPGGFGGLGGPAVGDSKAAGDGGDGADGGDSGAGGGGAGGPSCAVVSINSTVMLTNVPISGGSGGAGGAGGSGVGDSAGSPGDPGSLCGTLEQP